MPQTKYNCPSCRRLNDINSPYCRYCRTENPKMKAPSQAKSSNEGVFDDLGEELFDSFDDEAAAEPKAPVAKKPISNPPKPDNEEEADFIAPSKEPEPVKKPEPAKKPAQSSPAPEKKPQSDTLAEHSEDRKKIKWQDEKENPAIQRENMYDENGSYNPNYDGYYDDILPKINNEVDKILLNKEKTILKIVGAVVLIFGIIVYLVVTLN